MKTYEYFNQTVLGLPFNNIVSSYMTDLKTHYYSLVDDLKFKKKIEQTNVLLHKDYQRWNWEVILEILEGNLINNEVRLEEVLKKNKFIKRLLYFYMPSKLQFVEMEWKPSNFIYAQAGYHLIKTLLSTKDGKRVLNNAPGVFFMLGFSFVEKTENIFPQSKSFL